MATVGWIFSALGSAGLLVLILCAMLCKEPKTKGE